MTKPGFTAVAAAKDIEEKGFCTFDLQGLSIVICHFRGEFFAFENMCSHARSSFDGGRLRGYRIICPMHGGTFDIRDGSATGAPARKPLRTFSLRVASGMIEVDLGDAN
jgi:nitrite reductase/ring-hydroxylating ferredoxin subunit